MKKKLPIVVIPAFNPDTDTLISLVQKIHRFDISQVIIVNDGSRPEYKGAFDRLITMENTRILHHEENLGKGEALRSGFRHILKFKLPCSCIITMDADGQHLPEDVGKIVQQALLTPEVFILGVRRFDRKIPFRSFLGNRVTCLMFRGLVGQRISDTQTGLRAIPYSFLNTVAGLKADRYAFELEMLLAMVHHKVPMMEIPIKTVYENNNAASSFRPVADSILVYKTLFLWWFANRFKQLLKYSLSGIFSTVADFGTYILLINLSCGFVTASIIARILSILIHFSSNRYFTFSYKGSPSLFEVFKYLLVVAFNLISSIILIYLFVSYLSLGEVSAKVAAQMLLFSTTYALLNGFVFLRSKSSFLPYKNDRGAGEIEKG